MVLGHFLNHYLKYFDETWSEVRQNGQEVVAKDCRSILSTIEVIFRVKDSKNRPQSTKLYGWSKFWSKKNFIAFLESRDFNSCKKRIKKFSTRFSLYDVIMIPDLENFWSENFWTRKKFFELSKWFNSKSYHVKSEIWGPSGRSSL